MIQNQDQKILLLENIHPVAKKILESEGFIVDQKFEALSEAELCQTVGHYNLIGIRSKTEISKKVLEANPNLLCIGAFCIGTNQIQLNKARELGVPVFNAPYSNTRSVAELIIAETISLMRQLGDVNRALHSGEWRKSAKGIFEVRGKTLGIVGYGHIGTQVSILAESLGMKVLFYDIVKKLPLGNAAPVSSLKELLEQSQIVTLHVPDTSITRGMITRQELSWMRKGSYLLNASRGTVVEIPDLVDALASKHIAGAAIDVYPEEPNSNSEKFVSPLQNMPNTILTPHIGGSTEEAQYSIGIEVAESFIRFIKNGSTSGAVNFPHVDLPTHQGVYRIINVHRNEPGVLGDINGVVSKNGANIQSQYLSTDSNIGYLVMDVEIKNPFLLMEEIQNLPRMIRTRLA